MLRTRVAGRCQLPTIRRFLSLAALRNANELLSYVRSRRPTQRLRNLHGPRAQRLRWRRLRRFRHPGRQGRLAGHRHGRGSFRRTGTGIDHGFFVDIGIDFAFGIDFVDRHGGSF